jgi:hypothetical protein
MIVRAKTFRMAELMMSFRAPVGLSLSSSLMRSKTTTVSLTGVTRHAKDGRDHGRGELVAGHHEDADVHQDVMQRGRHGPDAEAELEAEGDVDKDDEHGHADGDHGVPLDLGADGGADLTGALLDQARIREGLLERGEELVGLCRRRVSSLSCSLPVPRSLT